MKEEDMFNAFIHAHTHTLAHTPIDDLAQNCSNSSALAMEVMQPCAKPSIYSHADICAHGCTYTVQCSVDACTQYRLILQQNYVNQVSNAMSVWQSYSHSHVVNTFSIGYLSCCHKDKWYWHIIASQGNYSVNMDTLVWDMIYHIPKNNQVN